MNDLILKTSSMRAMVLSDIAKLELREVPRPVVQQHEVLVRVSAVGLCGTDFHIFSGQSNYNINQRGKVIPLVEQPQILGHELVGIVEEVGSLVKDLHIGDSVVIDQVLNCVSRRRQPKCEYCASSDSHQCQFYVPTIKPWLANSQADRGNFVDYPSLPVPGSCASSFY